MFATLLADDLLSAELAKHGEERQAGELALGQGSGFGFRLLPPSQINCYFLFSCRKFNYIYRKYL
jgi:hypothetical protein